MSGPISKFIDQHYQIYFHWLNPGYHDAGHLPHFDTLGIVQQLLSTRSVVGIRNGQLPAKARVQELRTFVRDWALSHQLTYRMPRVSSRPLPIF